MPEQDKPHDQTINAIVSLRRRVAELEADAAQRRRIEQSLRESEERFRCFAAASFDGVVIHDKGRILDVNARYAEMIDRPTTELVGRNVVDFFDPDSRAEVTARVAAEDEQQYEALGLRADGSAFPCEIRARHMTYRGRRLRVAVFRDITARKRDEQTLRDSEQRFRAIVESSPMGVYLYEVRPDGELVLETANPAAETITGVRSASLTGKTLAEAFPALAGGDVAEHFQQVVRTGRPWYGDEVAYDDGRIGGVFAVHAFLTSSDRLVVMFSDVTSRKRAEQERRDLEAQVQHVQKLESLGVLAGGIAHDFNNLLMGVLGNADLALSALPAATPARENIEEIRRVSGRAADLCRQMLAYSGKGRFVIEPIILSDLVEEMAHMLEVSISKKAVLTFHFADNLPAVEADATQLRQVVMNLITNASEALGDRSGVISIATGAVECDRNILDGFYLAEELPAGLYVRLEVADTGCGMDAETQSRLFDPFFSTKFTGRGLGLAAVLGIIRGHKGAVRVHSKPSRGTTFTLLLPAVETAAPARVENAAAPAAGDATGCILLVDDEETVRTVGKRMLEHVGFDVVTAADGQEAIELFSQRQGEIACVICDLTMPRMDGEEAFRELRRIDPDVRVILSSGYNQQDVTQRFVGQGLAGFIQKPYRLDELAAKVVDILKG